MGVADAFVEAVTDGSLLVAVPVAAVAGLVSFLSPCVLPLVPGYLSFVTGLSGAELGETRPAPAHSASTHSAPAHSGRVQGELVRTGAPAGTPAPLPADLRAEPGPGPGLIAGPRRGRVLLGATLFVLGFSAVFVTSGALFGGLGSVLLEQQVVVDRVLGLLTVVMGLAFLGVIPGMQRTVRLRRLPNPGLAGAPLLGVLFGVGWTPCLGPTLAAVQTLAYREASAGRGALLTAAYCLGLGVPFLLTAVAMRRALGAFDVVKRHYATVMRIGGALLIVVGLLLVSGLWADLMIEVRGWVSGYATAV